MTIGVRKLTRFLALWVVALLAESLAAVLFGLGGMLFSAAHLVVALAILLAALAVGSLVRMLIMGPSARRWAPILFLFLVSARGPGGDLVAIRLCAAALLARLALSHYGARGEILNPRPGRG